MLRGVVAVHVPRTPFVSTRTAAVDVSASSPAPVSISTDIVEKNMYAKHVHVICCRTVTLFLITPIKKIAAFTVFGT